MGHAYTRDIGEGEEGVSAGWGWEGDTGGTGGAQKSLQDRGDTEVTAGRREGGTEVGAGRQEDTQEAVQDGRGGHKRHSRMGGTEISARWGGLRNHCRLKCVCVGGDRCKEGGGAGVIAGRSGGAGDTVVGEHRSHCKTGGTQQALKDEGGTEVIEGGTEVIEGGTKVTEGDTEVIVGAQKSLQR